MGKVWELDLPPNEKLILQAYADFADDAGNCWPSHARVAHKCCCSEDTIKRHRKSFQERGLLVLVKRGGGRGNPNHYRVQPEKGVKLPPFIPKGVQQERERGANEAERDAQLCPPNHQLKPSENHQSTSDLFGSTVPQTNGTPPRPDPNGSYSEPYENLWAASPGPKGGKRDGFKAYLKAVPVKITHADLAYLWLVYRESRGEGFDGLHLSTFINGEHWESARELHPQHSPDRRVGSSAARWY